MSVERPHTRHTLHGNTAVVAWADPRGYFATCPQGDYTGPLRQHPRDAEADRVAHIAGTPTPGGSDAHADL